MEYNFNYLLDLYDKCNKQVDVDISSKDSYEFNRIINSVDKSFDQHKSTLFHITPILYSCAFIGGLSYFIYNLFYI
jgi:hypothetical protein